MEGVFDLFWLAQNLIKNTLDSIIKLKTCYLICSLKLGTKELLKSEKGIFFFNGLKRKIGQINWNWNRGSM